MNARPHETQSAEEQENQRCFGNPASLDAYARETGLFPVEQRILRDHFPPPPAEVLDIGCGAGRTTRHLHELGYRVIAGDIVPQMVERARHILPGADIRVLDATRLELASNAFDAVWFSFNGLDCIYPFASRLQALSEIHRVLKPGGIFIYSSHNVLGRFTRVFRPYKRCLGYHLKFILQSLKNPVLQCYWREWDHGGLLCQYAGTPFQQIRTLRRKGFELIALKGKDVDGLWRVSFGDYWPHYIARRRTSTQIKAQ